MAPASPRVRYSTNGVLLDGCWHFLAVWYVLWICLLVICPLFTRDQCHISPHAHFLPLPIPQSSVCQCLDFMPAVALIKVARIRSCLGSVPYVRYPIVSLLLLLAGDVGLNPGPAALRFAHLNTNSIASVNTRRDKPALLQDFVIDRDIELLSVSETRLHENELASTLNSFTPENYFFIHNPRPGSTGTGLPGGGVGFLFRSYLNIKQMLLPVFDSFESMCIDFSVGSSVFKVLTVYRPPSSSVPNFLTDFSLLLEGIVTTKSEIIITGDFNFHVDLPDDNDARRFLELLDGFCLKQHVTFPTHKYGHTLDLLIFRNNSDIVSSVEIDYPCLSDHQAVMASFFIPDKMRPKTIIKSIRQLNKIDNDRFRQDILKSDLINKPALTLNLLCEQFTSTLTELINKHAPLREIHCTERISKPYITDNIRLEKSIRSRLETRYRKSRLAIDLDSFRNQTRKLKKLITTARRDYFKNLINKYKDKPRKLWSTMDNILGRRVVQTLPAFHSLVDITKSFLIFFNDRIAKMCSKLPAPTINPFSLPLFQPPTLTTFLPATLDEVISLITASSDSTCLLDCIPTSLLKCNVDILSTPLTSLINFSLHEGIFPDIFKLAHLKPLLKKHGLSTKEMGNFRPISNLSNVSKLLERIIYNRLSEHIHSFNMYSPFQSAYRRFFSTETALLKIQNDLLLAIDEQKVTALVLLDLSAAFDTIDHAILLHRLKNWFGISDSAFQLLSSYLSGRSQSVVINGHVCPAEPLTTGVPQGSVLGPLLFTIYTTPIAHTIQSLSFSFHLYADDTQIYISFASTEAAAHLQDMSATLDVVHSWFTSNRLTLNPTKTEFLIIGTRQQRAKLSPVTLTLSGTELVPVSAARNLGVVFDSELSYKSQISKVCQTSFLHIRQIRRVRHLLDLNSAILLANSLVSSRLDYCNSLYFGLPECLLDRLQRVQNSLARAVVPSVRRCDHVTPVLCSLHWLPVRKRIQFKIATLTFKVLNNDQPTYLRDLLKRHEPLRSMRSADKQLLQVPDIRSANGRRSFAFASPTIWNSLPLLVKSSTTIQIFRRNLKTHLFPP